MGGLLHVIDTRTTSMGGLFQNADGTAVVVLTRCFPYLMIPQVAEAICIKETLSWIKGLGVNNITIASDSLLSVEAINSPSDNDSYFAIVISDCKVLLSSFNSVSIRFMNRASNAHAHNLARAAAFLPNYSIWGGPFDLLLSSVLSRTTLINQ